MPLPVTRSSHDTPQKVPQGLFTNGLSIPSGYQYLAHFRHAFFITLIFAKGICRPNLRKQNALAKQGVSSVDRRNADNGLFNADPVDLAETVHWIKSRS